MKYVCDVCGYVYDPEIGDPDNGVDAGTAWEDVPEDWVCPLSLWCRQRRIFRRRIINKLAIWEQAMLAPFCVYGSKL